MNSQRSSISMTRATSKIYFPQIKKSFIFSSTKMLFYHPELRKCFEFIIITLIWSLLSWHKLTTTRLISKLKYFNFHSSLIINYLIINILFFWSRIWFKEFSFIQLFSEIFFLCFYREWRSLSLREKRFARGEYRITTELNVLSRSHNTQFQLTCLRVFFFLFFTSFLVPRVVSSCVVVCCVYHGLIVCLWFIKQLDSSYWCLLLV